MGLREPLLCLAAHWPLLHPWCLFITPEVGLHPVAPLAALTLLKECPDVVRNDQRLFLRSIDALVRTTDGAAPMWWLVWYYHAYRSLPGTWVPRFASTGPGTGDRFVAALHRRHLSGGTHPEDWNVLAGLRSAPTTWPRVAVLTVLPTAWFPIGPHDPPRVQHRLRVVEETDGAPTVRITLDDTGHLEVRLAAATSNDARWTLVHARGSFAKPLNAPRYRVGSGTSRASMAGAHASHPQPAVWRWHGLVRGSPRPSRSGRMRRILGGCRRRAY